MTHPKCPVCGSWWTHARARRRRCSTTLRRPAGWSRATGGTRAAGTGAEILYISKPGNRHVDLSGFEVESLDAPRLRCEDAYQLLRPFPEFSGYPDWREAGFERLRAMNRMDDEELEALVFG